MIKTIILCYKTVTWPLLQYCKNILCLLALIFHELGLGNKGNWESTKIKSKLTWNQLWPVKYYKYYQHYIVTTFFRSPSSITNVGQSFILSHTGRYNSNSDLFVLAIALTIHVYPNNDNKIPHNKALKCVAMMFKWHIYFQFTRALLKW